MIENPKVTVLMPVYNGQKFLRKAIESILNQTYKDFEFLIINDGSTDESEQIIKSYKDSRIRLINNDSNLKLIKSLNKGIELSNGEYIARMDCDDISLPDRLELQVKYMDQNPHVGVCGGWIKIFGIGKPRTRATYTQCNDIKCSYLFWGSLAHPSVMIRKNSLIENNLKYSEQFIHSEDYELWTRCLKYFMIVNLPVPVLMYRISENSVTNKNSIEQMNNTVLAMRENLKEFGIDFTEKEIILHKKISFYLKIEENGRDELKASLDWLNKILEHNRIVNIYDQNSLKKVIFDNWYTFCLANMHLGLSTIKVFLSSNLYKQLNNSKVSDIKYIWSFLLGYLKIVLKKNRTVYIILKKLV